MKLLEAIQIALLTCAIALFCYLIYFNKHTIQTVAKYHEFLKSEGCE